ncbi:MAG: trigger factor [Terriglobales bacterium]
MASPSSVVSPWLRNLEIEVPADEVERESTRIAQGFQKRARIPGFRPGKAPLSLVRQHFQSKIREEVVETLVPAHLRAAFERENLDPISTPSLDHLDYAPGSALKFKASFEVRPEFELGDYRALRAEVPPVVVSEADLDQALEQMREQRAQFEPSSAELVGEADVAVVEAVGDKVERQEIKVDLSSADTLPEFREAVRGMRPGEERELEIHYPAEHPNHSLAGQDRRYQLKLLRIETKLLPTLDDAWAQAAAGADSGIETLAELRRRIAASMRREREHAVRHQVEEAVVAQLLQQNEFTVPEAMVDQQIEARIERELMGLAGQGVDPRKLKLDWAKLRARYQDSAQKQVRTSLVLEKIAAREQIEPTPEALEAEVARAAQARQQPLEQVRARLTESGGMDSIKGRLRQARVLEFVLDLATQGALPITSERESEGSANS